MENWCFDDSNCEYSSKRGLCTWFKILGITVLHCHIFSIRTWRGINRKISSVVLQLPECEHVFCSACIERWLLESPKCPIDRKPVYSKCSPRPAPRIFRTLLSRMRIRCLFFDHGCHELPSLDQLDQHESTCEHNPEGLIMCGKWIRCWLGNESIRRVVHKRVNDDVDPNWS